MAELYTAEYVVIQGFVVGSATGKAITEPDTSEDAEPGDVIPAPVTSEPVALGTQKTLPMLRALGAHAHIQAQPHQTRPVLDTGYYALLDTATNDPDVEAYGGRKITLPDGTSKVVQVPYNAPFTTVTAAMAAQTGLAANTQVRAIWFADAAEYIAPPAGPTPYYTAPQVDSKLADLLASTVTAASLDSRINQLLDGAPSNSNTLGKLAARAQVDEDNLTAVTAAVGGKLAKASNLSDLVDPAAARNALGLKALAILDVTGTPSTTTFLRGDGSWAVPAGGGGGGGGGGSADQPEASDLALTAAVGASAMPSAITRFNTTSAAITQTLPTAIAGRILGVGWDAGTNALTVNAASRTDTATVTSGSATVSDAAITAADFGRLVTGTGVPSPAYVGTVTAGASFKLSSSRTSQVDVTATAAGTSVVVSDLVGFSTGTTVTLQGAGEMVLLHCTTTGRWRTWSQVRTAALLDGLYMKAAQRGPVGGVNDLGTIASGATVVPNATFAQHKGSAAGNFTLSSPTNAVEGQTVSVMVTASGANRVVTFGTGIKLSLGQQSTYTITSGTRARFLMIATSASTVDLANCLQMTL